MREIVTIKRLANIIAIFLLVNISALSAQPAPENLAEQLMMVNTERLMNVERVELHLEFQSMGFDNNSVTELVKMNENGYSWLEVVEDDTDSDLVSGVFDKQLPALVRGASSIESGYYRAHSIYHVVIDDSEYISSLSMDDFDMEDSYREDSKIALWIDSDEFIIRKAEFEMIDEADRVIITEAEFEDYQYFDGLPIATSIKFSTSGMFPDFSEMKIEEMEGSLREMEAGLGEMPEAQRRVILEQIEKYKDELNKLRRNGVVNSFELKVSNVIVNP